jgi:hypothetical protein
MTPPRVDHLGRELLQDIDAEAGTQSIYLDDREIDALVDFGKQTGRKLVCDLVPRGVCSAASLITTFTIATNRVERPALPACRMRPSR